MARYNSTRGAKHFRGTDSNRVVEEAPPSKARLLSSPKLLLSLLLVGMLYGVYVSATPIGPGEEDIWWHLKTGGWILQNRAIPDRDLFTHTTPPGTPWHDVQWFFQSATAAIHGISGWSGLIAFRLLCTLVLIGVLWGWLREHKCAPVIALLVVLVVLEASRFRITVRPELPTFALLAVQLWLYDRAFRTGKIPIPELLISQLFWANWHSSCLLGLGVAGVFVVTALMHSINVKRGEAAQFDKRLLLGLVPAMALVSLLNPHGWRMPVYALTEGRKSYVLEFEPPDVGILLEAAGIVAATSVIGWFGLARRSRLFHTIIAALFAVQAARMLRFQPYFAVATVALQAAGWRLMIERIVSLRALQKVAAGAAVIVITSLALWHSFRENSVRPLGIGVNDSQYPVGAADFVIKENINGALFNEFGTGGYLLYRFAPERQVFVFGETSLNGPVMERLKTADSGDKWRSIFEEYGVTYAVFENAQMKPSPDATTLPGLIAATWRDWRLVFWDDAGMVFVKNLPGYAGLIARRQRQILPEMIPHSTNFFPDIAALEQMATDNSRWSGIEQELLDVIKETPRHARAATALGIMRDVRNENPQKALEAFQIAEKLDPECVELLQYLAQWYLKNNNPAKAVEYQEKVLAAGLQSPEMYYMLGVTQHSAGQKERAQKTLHRMLRKFPDDRNTAALRQLLGN